MAVTDKLARRENRGYEFGAVDHGVEAALKKPDHIGAGIALKASRLVIDPVELPFRQIGVIALELLLGAQLHAVVGQLALAALAMLAGAIFTLVDGRLRPAPDVLAEPAVDLVLRLVALGHSRPR